MILKVFFEGDVEKIVIQRAQGGCDDCVFSTLYDEEYSIFDCPHTEKWQTGPLFLDIPRSLVEYVNLRIATGVALIYYFDVETFQEIPPEKIKVELCLKREKDCVLCGYEYDESRAGYITSVSCLDTTFETDQIKVTVGLSGNKPCQIEAYGKGYNCLLFFGGIEYQLN